MREWRSIGGNELPWLHSDPEKISQEAKRCPFSAFLAGQRDQSRDLERSEIEEENKNEPFRSGENLCERPTGDQAAGQDSPNE